MGNTKNPAGRRIFDDVYSFPQDSQDLADDIYANKNTELGTAAERGVFPTAQRKPGMLWSETDTGNIYRVDASLGWVLAVEPEQRPTSVVGGTVDAFGGIVPNSGVSTVRVNGVFSPRFRIYRVQFWLNMSSASAGLGFNLVAGGAPHTANQHAAQRLVANGSSVSASSSTGQTAWSGTGVIGSNLSGEWMIRNPMSQGLKTFSADASAAPGGSPFSQERGWLGGAESLLFDGFQFNASAGTFLAGFVKVQPQG